MSFVLLGSLWDSHFSDIEEVMDGDSLLVFFIVLLIALDQIVFKMRQKSCLVWSLGLFILFVFFLAYSFKLFKIVQ